MKRKYKVQLHDKVIEREYSYIPIRYIIALALTLLEVAKIIAIVVALCYYVPYFYIAAWLTEIFCVINIIASDDNPDYKVSWLLFVLILPIAGFMLYFIFYSRKPDKKLISRLNLLRSQDYSYDDGKVRAELREKDRSASRSAEMLTNISSSHLFGDTATRYYPLGEDMMRDMLADLEHAERFILLEYFIINEGKFWNSILDILKKKAACGVTIRVLYDDIGCMTTLPGNYHAQLAEYGIEAAPFARLRGAADGEFNNRSHRKILVIDGRIGYTGGVNIADEYINEIMRFGHWKDTSIRLEGMAVWELSRLFISDYAISVKQIPEPIDGLYPDVCDVHADGYLIPFGDGPRPLYERRVAKSAIQNMLARSTEYTYMTTPYLIIDNELCASIENAALRGVDVRIIVPHIPDKRIVYSITRSYYARLIKAGVRIYEYTPGFIHAKSYVSDDKEAIIGTVNLDYRSLVHHFENGVWMYGTETVSAIRDDIIATLSLSQEITEGMLHVSMPVRLLRSVVRIFAPLL